MMVRYFNEREVRFDLDGTTFWVSAVDVLRALGYDIASYGHVEETISFIPEEWKGYRYFMTSHGAEHMRCISEQGLYFFLGRSTRSEALAFQKWIIREILPTVSGSRVSEADSVRTHETDSVSIRSAIIENFSEILLTILFVVFLLTTR